MLLDEKVLNEVALMKYIAVSTDIPGATGYRLRGKQRIIQLVLGRLSS